MAHNMLPLCQCSHSHVLWTSRGSCTRETLPELEPLAIDDRLDGPVSAETRLAVSSSERASILRFAVS